ncbi:MAG: invasion associated locus B family protein [Rhodothalassiaceae bacterium]
MRKIGFAGWGAVLVVLMAIVRPVHAQAPKSELLGSYRSWDAFRAKTADGLICYMVSEPDEWDASRDGVRRGDIYITVAHKPEQNIRDEVNVVVGYPFKDAGEALAVIDGTVSFTMFTQGDGAWNSEARADARMVQAMKKGLKLVVTGTSSRGTITTDTYSLSGFTAAHNAISDACRV